jgi:hypothetical protein
MLPNIGLSDPPDAPPLGRYGLMRKLHLKEHRPILYNQLLMTEKLYPYLRNVDIIANEMKKRGVHESAIIKEIVCEK